MQYQYVVYLLGFGFLMGMIYDIYNTVTGASKWLRWVRPLLDILFWCVSGIAVYYVTFVTDNGRFRIYTFGLLLIGYFVYRVVLHHRVVRSAFAIMRIVRTIARGIFAVFHVLIIQPVWWLLRTLWFISLPLYKGICLLENMVFALLGFWLRVLAFPFQPLWRYFGAQLYKEFMDKWEGMCKRASKWLKDWPQNQS